MAAPAALPEFAGTVVAVETAPFWDMQVVALREREQSFKPDRDAIEAKMKSGELTREAGRAAIDELFAAEFTPRELTILRDSVSNFDFHYMGSGKIMAQIGKAFAEGLAEISER
jgi:alpha-galactosidase